MGQPPYYVYIYIFATGGCPILCVDHNYEMILTRYVCLKMGYTIPCYTQENLRFKTCWNLIFLWKSGIEIGWNRCTPNPCRSRISRHLPARSCPSKPHTWATRGAFYFYLKASPGHRAESHPPRCLFDTSLGWSRENLRLNSSLFKGFYRGVFWHLSSVL